MRDFRRRHGRHLFCVRRREAHTKTRQLTTLGQQRRHALAGIDGAAAADADENVYLCIPRQLDRLFDGLRRRVRLHLIEHRHAFTAEPGFNLVQEKGLCHRRRYQYKGTRAAEPLDFLGQLAQRARSRYHALDMGIVKSKICSRHVSPGCYCHEIPRRYALSE